MCLLLKSQENRNNSPLPVTQLHSSDSIVKYGRILSPDEVQAEYVKMNHSLLKFKKKSMVLAMPLLLVQPD